MNSQEKEKLKKRLQKLFETQGCLKKSGFCNAENNPQVKCNNMNTVNKPKSPKVHQPEESKNLGYNSLNKKKPEQSQHKIQNTSKPANLQNGFAKAKGKQDLGNRVSQPQPSPLKKDKEKVTKLQKKANSTSAKPTDHKSPKQQSCVNNMPKTDHKKNSKFQKRTIQKNRPKSKGNETKSCEKLVCKKSQNLKNGSKSESVSQQQSNSVKKNNGKIIKSQNKKSKKSAPLGGALKNGPVIEKKKKTIINILQNAPKKSNQNQNNFLGEYDYSSSELEDDYDVNNTTGCVRGCDFDSDSEDDNMEYNYGAQEKSYTESDYSSDNTSTSKSNNAIKKFSENPQADMKPYDRNVMFDSNEEYFNSDDENTDDEESECDSFEEEEDDYSDFDESNYEEEEDSFNYTTESDFEYSTENDEYDMPFADDDGDYELPKHVPEDLIIHKGTATKYDVGPEDNVSFNSENEEAQIVELDNQQTVKVIYQPKAYEKEELLKLKYEEKCSNVIKCQNAETTCDTENCPELVPIVDADGFQLYNPNEEMYEEEEEEEEQGSEGIEEASMEEYEDDAMDDVSLGSEYTEVNSDDADSLLSEDINEKYLKREYDYSDSDDSIDAIMLNKKYKADVIDATQYEFENSPEKPGDNTDTSLNDDFNQIPSVKLYANVDLKTESTILSTTVIDNKIIFSNDNFIGEVNAKSIESQKTPLTRSIPVDPADMSTPEEDECMEEENSTEELPKIAKSSYHIPPNYNTKFFNAFNSNLVIVLLKDPFYIYGTVRLTLLAGSMEVYGHSLSLNTEVEIFSPRGCSVIEISSTHGKNGMTNENLKHLLKAYEKYFALADLKTIATLYKCETDAVVLLKRNDARKKVVQQFKKFMNENVFPNVNNISADRPLYNSEYLLRSMINTSTQEQKCLRLPQEWQQFSLTAKSRVMLVGGKSVGKSTLLRYLINRHLPQKVLLIDLDIGQPEVFIPQTVSCTIINQPLLGPGFLLNLQPEISYAVGHTNIALCAHKYLNAVRSLIAHCKAQDAYKEIPWLINTMGYNKGFGLELISILAQEPLTDVIQLQSAKEINNFECTLHAHVLSNIPHILFSEEYERNKLEIKDNWNYRLHVWKSAVTQESRYQKEWEMSAKDLRFAILLARLSEALQGHAEWLTDVKPMCASLNDLKIVNLMDNTTLASAEDLEKAVEANLVYLCHHEEDFKSLTCLGIGVVRAIDFHIRQIYLIPALPYAQLGDINCLGIGEMPLPTSLFTNQGPRVKNIAPFVYNTISANASKAIKQIYHRPAKFLTGKHKSLL